MTRRTRTGFAGVLSPVVLVVCAFMLASGTAAFAYLVTSASGTGQAQAITLSAPGAGATSSPTPSSLNLSWGASSGLPTGGGYVVLRSTSNPGPYAIVSGGTCDQSDTSVSAATSCIDDDPLLVPGTTYYYEVEAAYYNGSTLWVSAPNTQFSGATTKATPTIATTATPSSVTVGGSVADQATLSGGYNPGGTITWSLYANTSCSAPPLFVSGALTVSGDGTYAPSTSYPTTVVGSDTWAFTYSGDPANNSVSACGGPNESLAVTQAKPSLSTAASTNANGTVTDVATISGGYDPTGTITYTLYGPSTTASCTAVDTVTSVTNTSVSGNGSYPSPPITPPSAGTYWWITSYGGDTNNAATANTCGQSGESSIVPPVTPTITTMATPSTVTAGGSVADQATVSGGDSPTGVITWSLYKNSSCTGTPVFTTSGGGTLTGNSTYTSFAYTITTAGIYTWAFSYSGDKNNNALSACGGTNETLTVYLALNPSTLPAAMVGQSYNCGTTITASGGTAPYTYTVTGGSLPPGLSLNPTTGAVTGTPTAGGTFTFTVTATDSAGPPHNTGSKTYTLTVNPPIISIGPSTVPNGTAGTPYATQTISAEGGTSPYTYAKTSGTLPPGLVLSSAGVLGGTPSAAGSFTFTVTATDSSTGTGPYTGSRSYTVTINNVVVDQAPSITSASSATFIAGTAGSFGVTTTGTPTPTLTNANFGTCTPSVLPSGVTFTNNGNGTATIASTTASPGGTYILCLNATNGVSPNATQKFTLTIDAGKLVFTSAAVSGATSSTPNLGPITVQRQSGSGTPITSGGALTVTLSSSPSSGATFGTSQFGATVTTVTIPSSSASTTIWYGLTTTGTPTITASAASYVSGTELETITTAPAGLGMTLASGSTGTPVISCGTPAASYTCKVTGVGNGGHVVFFANFWDSTKHGVVYSATQSSTITETGQNSGSVTIAPNASSSTPSTLTASHTGSSTGTSTLRFGPYALTITVSS